MKKNEFEVKRGDKLINKNNGKKATFVRQDKNWFYFVINGIEAVLPKNIFYKVYELDK